MFALDKKKDNPRFYLGLGATLGVYTGFSRQNRITYDGQHVESEVSRTDVLGYGGSLNQRLSWQSKKGNFQVFLENRGEFARLVYDVVPSGKATQLLFANTINFGVGFKIFQKNQAKD
jgi:hypothetical protein